jgi:hypothetical protein
MKSCQCSLEHELHGATDDFHLAHPIVIAPSNGRVNCDSYFNSYRADRVGGRPGVTILLAMKPAPRQGDAEQQPKDRRHRMGFGRVRFVGQVATEPGQATNSYRGHRLSTVTVSNSAVKVLAQVEFHARGAAR